MMPHDRPKPFNRANCRVSAELLLAYELAKLDTFSLQRPNLTPSGCKIQSKLAKPAQSQILLGLAQFVRGRQVLLYTRIP